MSASTGLARQEDGFDKLLKLATLNADDIAKAGEENRRQIQLTQEEQTRVTEARNYITKHTTLATDLQAREEALTAHRAEHTQSVEAFNKHVSSENKRLEEFSAKLDARDKATGDALKKAEQTAKDAVNIKADYDRQHREAMLNIETIKSTYIEIGKKLVIEEQRLKDWEASLKARAERVRQEAAKL